MGRFEDQAAVTSGNQRVQMASLYNFSLSAEFANWSERLMDNCSQYHGKLLLLRPIRWPS